MSDLQQTADPPQVDKDYWLEPLNQGRAADALKYFSLLDDADVAMRRSLEALKDVQDFCCAKSWQRAQDQLERLEDPADLTDWQQLKEQLALLKESSFLLDRRQVNEALELLYKINNLFLLAEVETQRGTAYIYQKDTVKAEESLSFALERDPRHYRALTNLGNLKLEQGELDAAIEMYEQAIKLNDDFANAHHNLGVAYRQKGEFGKSVRELRKAQRASTRKDVEDSRAAMSRGTRGQGGVKIIRWGFYALIAVAVFLLLRSQGVL